MKPTTATVEERLMLTRQTLALVAFVADLESSNDALGEFVGERDARCAIGRLLTDAYDHVRAIQDRLPEDALGGSDAPEAQKEP